MLPNAFHQLITDEPGNLAARPQRGRDEHIRVSTGRDMGGQVVADMISARQKRGHHDRRPARGLRVRKHLAGSGAQHVDERDFHRAIRECTHLCRKVFNHRHAVRAAGAVRSQDQGHGESSGWSIASR